MNVGGWVGGDVVRLGPSSSSSLLSHTQQSRSFNIFVKKMGGGRGKEGHS